QQEDRRRGVEEHPALVRQRPFGADGQAGVCGVDAVSEGEVAGQDPGREPGDEKTYEDPGRLQDASARGFGRAPPLGVGRRATEGSGLLPAEARHLAPAAPALVDAVGLLLLGHPWINVAGPLAGTAW